MLHVFPTNPHHFFCTARIRMQPGVAGEYFVKGQNIILMQQGKLAHNSEPERSQRI